jgi:hypothetical protein
VVVACSAGGLVLAAGALAGRWKRPQLPAAALAAAAVVPWASFAEVDVPWMALCVGGAAVANPWVAGVLLALATAVSPVALLAMPWVWRARAWPEGQRGVVALCAPTLLFVVGISVASAGAWWLGPRGLFPGIVFAPWRVFTEGLAAMPWFSLPLWLWGWLLGGAPGLLAAAPLLLAPPDLPVSVLVAVSLGLGGARAWAWARGRRRLLLLFALLIVADLARSGAAWRGRAERVRTEHGALQSLVSSLEPGDRVVAPWTWGARASVLATGKAYGLDWRTPDKAEPAWCDQGRVRVLPPDSGAPPGCG